MRNIVASLLLLSATALFPAALAAKGASIMRPIVYVEGAIGIDQHKDGLGMFDHRTLGSIVAGVDFGGVFIEFEHISDVQVADDYGGYNVIWLGLRKEWQIGR